MRVVVIGAGKMGLPLACQMAFKGAEVVACDSNLSVVEQINRGICPFEEPGVPELLKQVIDAGRLSATTSTATAVSFADVVIVIVPVLLTQDNRAELSVIVSVTEQIAAGLKPGTMVSYETTVPVGTTRSFIPILERSGLKAGVDFDLVFSPERVKSQLVLKHLTKNPKVVGGVHNKAAERAAQFYEQYLGAPTINLGTLEAAEFSKIAGMIYRDVNIALANELAHYAEALGIEFQTVLDSANTDGEASILSPGIGVGGHCTPVYPYFLIRDAEDREIDLKLPMIARKVNDGQADYFVDRLEREFGAIRGKNATILGLGFRPEVKEHTMSPAFLIQDALKNRGAYVSLNDPLYTEAEIRFHGFQPSGIEGDVLVLNTAHEVYTNLNFGDLASIGVKAVIDGRSIWNPRSVTDAGIFYIGVGRPTLARLCESLS